MAIVKPELHSVDFSSGVDLAIKEDLTAFVKQGIEEGKFFNFNVGFIPTHRRLIPEDMEFESNKLIFVYPLTRRQEKRYKRRLRRNKPRGNKSRRKRRFRSSAPPKRPEMRQKFTHIETGKAVLHSDGFYRQDIIFKLKGES